MACPGEVHVQLCQREKRQPTLRAWRLFSAFFFLLSIFSTPLSGGSTSPNASSEMHRGHARSVRVPAIDGNDIRFSRLSTAQGLSQTQVNEIVQDDQGFIWFGTQYGLDRYDGYEFKVFTHDPAHANSLSCVYIHSLFKDRSGSLGVGCDQFLDRFDSLHETFTHYRIDAGEVANYVSQISQDRTGMLWLATGSGLVRAPATFARGPSPRIPATALHPYPLCRGSTLRPVFRVAARPAAPPPAPSI